MSDMAERELAQEPARERADWMEKAGEYLERLHEAELERDAANRRYRELAAAREDTERPEELEVIEGLFRAGLRHVEMSVVEQERLVEQTERVLQRHGRRLPAALMQDTERPDPPR